MQKAKEYTEIPLDDLSGKETPNRQEVRAQQAEEIAACRSGEKA